MACSEGLKYLLAVKMKADMPYRYRHVPKWENASVLLVTAFHVSPRWEMFWLLTIPQAHL